MSVKENGLINSWRNVSSSTSATSFLLLLLAVDLAFVFLHFLQLSDAMNNELFSLERDRGFPELFQYIKIFLIVILLLSVRTKTRVVGYGLWSLLFLYLLLDDALSIHESFGGYIATTMAFAPAIGLRAQDFGELAVSVIAAALILSPLAVFYLRGSDAFKEATKHLLMLLMALAFFGIFVDMLHVAIDAGWKIRFLLGVVEDGGEMIVVSIMAWYVFLLNGCHGNISSALRQAE